MIRIPQNGYAGHRRHRVFEQFNRLSSQHVVDISEAGDISSRPTEARDKATFNRIIANDHDDRNSCRRFLNDRSYVASKRVNHVWIEADQLFGHLPKPFGFSVPVAVLNGNVFSINVPERFQPFDEWTYECLILLRKEKDPDPPRARSLLGADGERPRSRTANKTDKFSPPHAHLPWLG